MIDWLNLLSNSLWILGLAVGLSVISMAHWEAQVGQQKITRVLSQSGKYLLLNLAGVLFCAGLAATSTRWWEIALWLLMLVLIIFQAVPEIRRRISGKHTNKNSEDGDK